MVWSRSWEFTSHPQALGREREISAEMAWAFETFQPTPVTHLRILSKQFYQLGPSARTCVHMCTWGLFSFNPQENLNKQKTKFCFLFVYLFLVLVLLRMEGLGNWAGFCRVARVWIPVSWKSGPWLHYASFLPLAVFMCKIRSCIRYSQDPFLPSAMLTVLGPGDRRRPHTLPIGARVTLSLTAYGQQTL